MPILRCQSGGKRGFKFGESGKCFVGKGGRAKAARQGRAIKANAQHGVTVRKSVVVPSNPLKADPSRTATLRRVFERDMRKRFRILKGLIIDLLVTEDAFALKREVRSPFFNNQEQDDGNSTSTRTDGRAVRGVFAEKKRRVGEDPESGGRDSQSNDENECGSDILHSYSRQRSISVNGHDGQENGNAKLSTNTRFRFLTDPEKVDAFRQWLDVQVQREIITVSRQELEDAWWRKYIQEGYEKGQGRAFDDVRQPALASGSEQLSFFEGTKREFLRQSFARPESVEKVKLLVSRVFTDLKGVTEAMSAQMTRVLADGLTQGQNPRQIARALNDRVDKIGVTRANVIARTEIIRAHAEGQLDALEQLGVTEVGVMVEWSTAGDDRVCFPAWTSVETENGPVSIQNIKPGNLVYTRSGLQKVIGTMARDYEDCLVTITTDRGKVTATKDHPFWTDQGWLEIGELRVGDWIREFELDQLTQVRDVVHLNFGNTAYLPSLRQKVFSLFKILDLILMPIRSINLKSDSQIREQKVNTVSPYSSLLNKVNLHLLQNKPDSFFNRCFSFVSSVAGETTKPLISLSRAFAKSFIAIITIMVYGGTSAFFRAMLPVKSSIYIRLLVPDFLSTRTSLPLSLQVSYFTVKGAIAESVGYGLVNLKSLGTSHTNLGNFIYSRRFIANSGAKLSALGNCCSITVNKFSTSGTWNVFSCFDASGVTGMRAKRVLTSFTIGLGSPGKFLTTLITYKLKRHCLHLLSNLFVFYHRLFSTRIVVYDIQVENHPEFFANGFLVHNCPRCQPMEGVVLKIKEARGLIPLHAQCRCAHIPANVGESQKGQTRSKTEIDKSIRESIKAFKPKHTNRTIAQQKALTPFAGKTISKRRPKGQL